MAPGANVRLAGPERPWLGALCAGGSRRPERAVLRVPGEQGDSGCGSGGRGRGSETDRPGSAAAHADEQRRRWQRRGQLYRHCGMLRRAVCAVHTPEPRICPKQGTQRLALAGCRQRVRRALRQRPKQVGISSPRGTRRPTRWPPSPQPLPRGTGHHARRCAARRTMPPQRPGGCRSCFGSRWRLAGASCALCAWCPARPACTCGSQLRRAPASRGVPCSCRIPLCRRPAVWHPAGAGGGLPSDGWRCAARLVPRMHRSAGRDGPGTHPRRAGRAVGAPAAGPGAAPDVRARAQLWHAAARSSAACRLEARLDCRRRPLGAAPGGVQAVPASCCTRTPEPLLRRTLGCRSTGGTNPARVASSPGLGRQSYVARREMPSLSWWCAAETARGV